MIGDRCGGEQGHDVTTMEIAVGQGDEGEELVARFERAFAAFHQCAFGVAAANGTLTLEMALEAAGIGPGDEVIVPAISFISTASAVSRVGATPVFVDVLPDTYNIDPVSLEAAIAGVNAEWSEVTDNDGARDERLRAGYAEITVTPNRNLAVSAGARPAPSARTTTSFGLYSSHGVPNIMRRKLAV